MGHNPTRASRHLLLSLQLVAIGTLVLFQFHTGANEYIRRGVILGYSSLSRSNSEVYTDGVANNSRTISDIHNDFQVNDPRNGVSPVYLSLLDEAYERAEEDYETSHTRGERGVVIGPTEGAFRHTVKGLRNARRIRNILNGDNITSIKIALMTSDAHIKILQNCSMYLDLVGEVDVESLVEGCRLWDSGALLDDLIPTIDDEYKSNDDHAVGNTSFMMLKNMASYRHGPYTMNLFVDTDAYPCPGFDKLFDLVKNPGKSKAWQLPITPVDADVAVGMEQFKHGPGSKHHFVPGDPKILTGWFTFTFRNDGVVLFHFKRKIAHVFAHFLPLVTEHVYQHVGTKEVKVVNDQTPFAIAMYLFRRLVPEFLETPIPMHSSCRSYPGKAYAGTDGFINGMLPIQQDGKHCSECKCSPCLVSHFASEWLLNIDGKKGWELE